MLPLLASVVTDVAAANVVAIVVVAVDILDQGVILVTVRCYASFRRAQSVATRDLSVKSVNQ